MRELQMATDGSDIAPQFIGLSRTSVGDAADVSEVKVQTADVSMRLITSRRWTPNRNRLTVILPGDRNDIE